MVVVHDGHTAITLLDQNRDFELVLLDVIMPGLDGVQVLSWIKNHNELRHVPVIMISGLADDKRTVDCIAAGPKITFPSPSTQYCWTLESDRAFADVRQKSTVFGSTFHRNSLRNLPAIVEICCEHEMQKCKSCFAIFGDSVRSASVLVLQQRSIGSAPRWEHYRGWSLRTRES